MDRRMRPVYVREKSTTTGGGDGQQSPTTSPYRGGASPMAMRHARSGSIVKRSQNTKVAAQRLAQVMTYQQTDDSEDDVDDLLYDYNPVTSSATAGRSQIRPCSPMIVRTATQHSAPRTTSINRSSQQVMNNAEQVQPLSTHSSFTDQTSNFAEQIQPPIRQFSSPLNNTLEHVQPTSARSNRSPQLVQPVEQPSSARSVSVGRPSLGLKPITMVPPGVSLSLRPTYDPEPDGQKNKRLSLDMGAFAFRESSKHRSCTAFASTSALQDELDMLQEENESLIEKLRLAEERCEEAEVRARQLEKQVANLGEGVSLEAKLLSRKEAALQQREAALKAAAVQNAAQTIAVKGGELEALRLEAENARDEADSVMEQLHETESEVKSLMIMTQRLVLTHEEMEEVVLKRCWLARYWSLCVQHGIHAEIAGARYEYWSSYAPLPVEVVIAAGQKAKDDGLMVNNDKQEREKVPKDTSEISGEGSVECMLLVEKGLREMTLLKVEDALAVAMAQQRRPSALKAGFTVDELKLPIKGQTTGEAYELSKQESEDVLFKQAWLTYIWRRVKIHGLERDIVDERLQFWINQGDKPPTSHDAVDVEHGLVELRKLGIEAQLWQASRKLVDPDSDHKWQMHTNF